MPQDARTSYALLESHLDHGPAVLLLPPVGDSLGAVHVFQKQATNFMMARIIGREGYKVGLERSHFALKYALLMSINES